MLKRANTRANTSAVLHLRLRLRLRLSRTTQPRVLTVQVHGMQIIVGTEFGDECALVCFVSRQARGGGTS
jgi:hypothetical protein